MYQFAHAAVYFSVKGAVWGKCGAKICELVHYSERNMNYLEVEVKEVGY